MRMPDRRWLPPALIAGAYAYSLAVYARLPERVPTHWNAAGEVDGWSGRAVGAFLMPTVALGLWLLFLVLPRLDPRRANYARFGPTYDLVVATVIVFQVALHVLLLGVALGWPVAVDTVIIVGVGLLLLLLGNVLPRVRPNWFIGIRTPWTLSSDRAWEKTHRVGGYIFSAAGLVVVAAAALPAAWKTWVIVAAAATITHTFQASGRAAATTTTRPAAEKM